MRTHELAKAVGIHVNTVRLYEEWGYISPVPRMANGYRSYNELHLQQLKIARLAFRHEFIQNKLRKRATALVRLSGSERFHEALQAATTYLQHLQNEAEFVALAVETVRALLGQKQQQTVVFTHRQVAEHLQLTEETIRNWERNGLFSVKRDSQNRRIYDAHDVQKLLVIRTLRSAHFSIASIRQFFEAYSENDETLDVHELLRLASFQSDFYHVTDDLEHNLKMAMTDVQSIITILQQLQ